MIRAVGASSRLESSDATAGDWLRVDALRAAAGAIPLRIELVDRIGSTNDELLSRPLDVAPCAPVLLVAREQHAGRGRRGRRWISDRDACLTFSLSLDREVVASPNSLGGLSLAVGVVLAEVLGAWVRGLQLKWPNDLLREGRKCAGVLVEARRVADVERAVVGIGLNLRTPPSAKAAAGQAVCGLFDDATPPPCEQLLGRIVAALCEMWQTFAVHGVAPFVNRWSSFDGLRDQQVDIVEAGRVLMSGRAMGIEDSGALRVLTERGVMRVTVGDVSARRREP